MGKLVLVRFLRQPIFPRPTKACSFLSTEGISEVLPASPNIRVPAESPQIEEGRGSNRISVSTRFGISECPPTLGGHISPKPREVSPNLFRLFRIFEYRRRPQGIRRSSPQSPRDASLCVPGTTGRIGTTARGFRAGDGLRETESDSGRRVPSEYSLLAATGESSSERPS